MNEPGPCTCHRLDRHCPQHQCQFVGCEKVFGHHGKCDSPDTNTEYKGNVYVSAPLGKAMFNYI